VGGQHHTPVALPMGKRPCTHRTARWVGPRMVWMGAEKLSQPRLNAWTIYPVASRYTDYSIHLIMFWKETNQLMAMLLLQFFMIQDIQYKVNTNEWLRIITSLPLILTGATSIQFKSLWQIIKISSYLCLNFPSSIFQRYFQTTILLAFLVSPIYTKCPTL
jgi:hypothetical protein